MIDAYRAGVPGNGKHFPDGSKIAKIRWKAKKSTEAPAPMMVPDTLRGVDFIERDSKEPPARRLHERLAWAHAPSSSTART
jgi:hypothetical protein